MTYRLTFDDLQAALLERTRTYRNAKGELETCEDWTPSDWVTAFIGEVGEACNILKKVRRGDFPMNAARPAIAKELADAQAYLCHLARKCSVDLGEATLDKFNEISARIGSPVRLPHVHVLHRPRQNKFDNVSNFKGDPQPPADANWSGKPLEPTKAVDGYTTLPGEYCTVAGPRHCFKRQRPERCEACPERGANDQVPAR